MINVYLFSKLHGLNIYENEVKHFVKSIPLGVNFNNSSVSRYFDVTPTTPVSGSLSEIECSPSALHGVQQLIEDVICGFKRGNVHYFK